MNNFEISYFWNLLLVLHIIGFGKQNKKTTYIQSSKCFLCVFLAFDFCQFCMVIRFFHPRHNDLWLRRIFYPRFYPLHFFPYLNSSERARISLLMLSAKQGNYWYHFYYVFGMTRSLSGIEPGTSKFLRVRYLKPFVTAVRQVCLLCPV